MKKVSLTLFILLSLFTFYLCLDVQAKERAVTPVGSTGIISEGLYFKVSNVCCTKNVITLTVQAKNKSILSQALYVELTDGTTSFVPLKSSSMGLFSPLKFNKLVTEKLVFNVGAVKKDYKIAIYSRDVFKKDKKQLITKMSLKDIRAELEKAEKTKTRTFF